MASSVGAAVRSGLHGWVECVRVAAGRRSDRERGWGCLRIMWCGSGRRVVVCWVLVCMPGGAADDGASERGPGVSAARCERCGGCGFGVRPNKCLQGFVYTLALLAYSVPSARAHDFQRKSSVLHLAGRGVRCERSPRCVRQPTCRMPWAVWRLSAGAGSPCSKYRARLSRFTSHM